MQLPVLPVRRARHAVLAALSVLVPALASHAATPETSAPRGCATLLVAGSLTVPGGPAAQAQRGMAATLSGRTLLTGHFAVHYTLAPNVHRVRLTAQDAALKALADSLRAALPGGLSTYRRDSTVHAKLDSLGAPHPEYAVKAAQHFERAYAYYDSLGMRMPAYASTSTAYLLPGHGRYVVDLADINTAAGYAGAYYGLAYPPGQGGSILLENDFLYSASYNPATDQVGGLGVRAFYPAGVVFRDYSVSWEMGLKVTASHEFYHSVQYMYTPQLTNIHAWYELSATGMEERLAPEVNDYLQYTRFNIPKNHTTSLTTAQTNENYGNAVFHMYLTHVRGAGFDRLVWERLGDTALPRNHMPTALVHMAGSQAAWDSLFAGYAAAMALSGSSAAATSPLAFSPDMPQWPRPTFDTVPPQGVATLAMPPLTFRLLRPRGAQPGVATLSGPAGAWRLDSTADGVAAAWLSGSMLPVTLPAGVAASVTAVANASFSAGGTTVLAGPVATVTAARNPVERTQAGLLFLAPAGGAADTLRVFSETGRQIANLAPDGGGASWNWNLRDPQNRPVPPGLYFYGTGTGAPKPLVVMP